MFLTIMSPLVRLLRGLRRTQLALLRLLYGVGVDEFQRSPRFILQENQRRGIPDSA